MRRIEPTLAFKRDYKWVKSSPKLRDVESRLAEVLKLLIADAPLPPRNRDHPFSGEWKDFRDCHVKPDLVLINLNWTAHDSNAAQFWKSWSVPYFLFFHAGGSHVLVCSWWYADTRADRKMRTCA